MAVNIPNLPCYHSGLKKKPLPLWFQKWISKKKLVRYKDILVPYVQFKVISKNDSGNVFVGMSINNLDVYGSILVFPYSWSQAITTDSLQIGFQQKLSRHLNMVAKGSSRGTPQQMKLAIDSTFQVKCILSPRHQKIPNVPIVLKTNALGSVLTQNGKVVGMSGKALFKKFNQMVNKKTQKKKRHAFNPSSR